MAASWVSCCAIAMLAKLPDPLGMPVPRQDSANAISAAYSPRHQPLPGAPGVEGSDSFDSGVISV